LRDGEAFTFLLALIIVVETTKGTFAFETYDSEAPKTVAHVVDLVRHGFYDGQRIHRVAPRFVVQWGDPRSRDLDGQQTVFGHVTEGDDVPARLERGDQIIRMYVRE